MKNEKSERQKKYKTQHKDLPPRHFVPPLLLEGGEILKCEKAKNLLLLEGGVPEPIGEGEVVGLCNEKCGAFGSAK
jgi:hypothetical protein